MGFEENLYIVYKKDSAIYTQKSTNGGQSWSTGSVANVSLSNSASDGIDIATDANGLHLTFSVYDPAQSGYETHYRMVRHDQSYWQDIKHVTDQTDPWGSGYTGGIPSITLSNNRVHIAFTKVVTGGSYATGDANYRERYNGVWQGTEHLFGGASSQSYIIPLQNKLHAFHYDHGDIPLPHGTPSYYLSHDYTDISSQNWYDDYTILVNYGTSGPPNEIYRLDVAKTMDSKIHLVYGGNTYEKWDGSQFTDQFTYGSGSNNKITANSNDVYVLWIDDDNETLKLRQRDFAPLAPQNLAITNTTSGALLTWSANTEADLAGYEVYRSINGGSINKVSGSNPITENSFNMCDIRVTNNEYDEHSYYVKAIDHFENASDYSTPLTVNIEYTDCSFEKLASGSKGDDGVIEKFLLNANYPNPFNPTTTITFALPEKTPVQLRVFDLNGRQVAELINREIAAGEHEVFFDASNLPSGVYLYRLTSPSFTQTRKMMLIK